MCEFDPKNTIRKYERLDRNLVGSNSYTYMHAYSKYIVVL